MPTDETEGHHEPGSPLGEELCRVPAIMAGPVALRHLRQGQRSGDVLAAFRQSAYVRLGPDEIICLCSSQLRPGPLNVSVEAPETLFAGLWPGAPVGVGSAALNLDRRHVIDFASTIEWHPPEPTPRESWCDIACGLAMVARHLEERQLSEGFGPLIGQLCTDWRRLAAPSQGGLDLLKLAVPALRELLAWLADGHDASLPAPVAGLIGLGPGLTPSGDDLLCGVLITLHATSRKHLASRLAEAVRREAASGTGIISRAHLSCACEGLGSDALHEAVGAVLGCTGATLEGAFQSLSRTGHSSGWDGLAGVVACLAVVEASQPPSRTP